MERPLVNKTIGNLKITCFATLETLLYLLYYI